VTGSKGCSLVFFQHHFGRFDHYGDLVAFLEGKLLRAAASDHAFNLALPDAYDDMRHDVTQCDFYYFSL